MNKKVSRYFAKLLVCILSVFVVSLPIIKLTESSCHRLYIFSYQEEPEFTDSLRLNTICSDQLTGDGWLIFEGENYIAPKRVQIFNPEDIIQAEILTAHAGNYSAKLMIYKEGKTFFSDPVVFNITSEVPTFEVILPSGNELYKVKKPEVFVSIKSSQPLIEASIVFNNNKISMECITEKEWNYSGILKLEDGQNKVLIEGINNHHVKGIAAFEILYQKPKYTKRIPVIGYHDIGLNGNDWMVTPQEFENHLQYLTKNGYYFCTPKEVLMFSNNWIRLPENSVLITFDDACSGVFTYALPLLKKYNAKATLFVVNSFLETKGYLTWEELDAINSSNVFTLGSHSYALHGWVDYSMIFGGGMTPKLFHLHEETWDEYLIRVKGDLLKSKEELELRYGKEINFFAYPFGAYDKETIKRVKETGFSGAFTFNRSEHYIYRWSNCYAFDRIPVLKGTKAINLFD
ncbi:MAG: polysaccharide deacetylase family protein [Caldisericia bacterium]|nr:polysaccharide deacetylase family protein [Caldisericia bacterium]